MIVLRISKENISAQDVRDILCKNNVDCECWPYFSSIKGIPEDGVSINLFDITEDDFKQKVWEDLVRELDIKCGFVESYSYRGCTSNWPGVFVESNCP